MYDVTMYMRIYYINDLLYELRIAVAYLRFHISGRAGFKIFFLKSRGMYHAAGGKAKRLLGGFGGMLPRKFF